MKKINRIFQPLTEILTNLPPAIRPLLANSPAAFPYPVCLINLREKNICLFQNYFWIWKCLHVVLPIGFLSSLPSNVLLAEDEEELGDHGGDVAGGVGEQAHQPGLQAVPLLGLCFQVACLNGNPFYKVCFSEGEPAEEVRWWSSGTFSRASKPLPCCRAPRGRG